jgi:hypothetical protein
MVRTGSSGYLQYGKESTFGGGATQTRVFGLEQKLSGITWKNNQMPLTALNDIEVQCYAYGKNEGSGSVEFVLSTPWIFDILLDAVDTSGSALDYTHIWNSDKTALTADNSGVVNPHTMHIEHGFDAETADVVRNMKGVIINTLSLKASLGETVKATAELAWGKEDAVSTSVDTTIAADDIKFPYTFAHATLELPDSTVVAQLQEFEINFNMNTELLYGMGSADAVSAFRKIFEMTGKFKAATVDKTQIQRVFDAADGTTVNTGVATLQITLTNDLATTAEKAIILDFAGVGVSEHQTDMSPGEAVFETLSWQLRNVQVTAHNSVATPA